MAFEGACARRISERYEILEEPIGAGATASVHLARMTGALGFRTTVAIKRLHQQLARDAAFRTMLLEEARLTSRVRHPNVVRVIDVEEEAGEIFLVMAHVRGGTLHEVIDRVGRPPVPIAAAIALAVVAVSIMTVGAAFKLFASDASLDGSGGRSRNLSSVDTDAGSETFDPARARANTPRDRRAGAF